MSWRDWCGPYIAAPELKQRGWTPAMITQFLSEPDETAPNPGGRGAPRVKLWRFTRVESVEATEEFQQRRRQADRRRLAQPASNRQPPGRAPAARKGVGVRAPTDC